MQITRCFLALSLALSLVPSGLADNKPQTKKNDEAEIRAAQQKLDQAQKEAATANKEAQDAKQHVAKVRGDLISLRRTIEDKAEGSQKLKQAHERADRAKATLKPLLTPLLAAVQQSPEFIATAKQRDQLRVSLAASTPEQRAVVARQIADAEAALRKLEAAAIDGNPTAVKAKAALADAEEQLRKELAAADDVLLKNPRYAAAKRDLEKAEGQAETAAARAVAKQRAVAAAQNKVRSELAEERKEDQKERAQQQKKKNNNNKKKK